MANPTLGAGRAKTATIAVTDKFGNPASIDGLPVWESTDETIAAVNPSADGLSCTVISTGKMGTVQINVRLDADLGDGVRELNGMALLDVSAGAASAIALLLSEDFDTDMPDTPDEDGEDPAPTPTP
jgi:hypothetical protein